MKMTDWGRYYVGAPTPFNADGELSTTILTRQVRYYLECGCAGILVNGFTGEWFSLAPQERRQALDAVVGIVGRQVPVVAFVGSTSLAETITFIADAEKAKASAIAITPPAGVNHEPQGIIETFKIWAAAARLPIMLYNLPSEIANNLQTDTVLQLAELPNVVAMKDVPTPIDQSYRTAAALNGRLRLFGSYMDQPGITFIKKHGLAHGYLGSGMLFGQWMSKFFDRLDADDIPGAQAICDRFSRFSSTLFGLGIGHYWSVVKLVTDIQVGTQSYSRLPVRTILDQSARNRVGQLLEEFEVAVHSTARS